MNDNFKPENSRWKLDRNLYAKYENKIANVINESGLDTFNYLPKKGDVLIWHGNLLHGSRPKSDALLTRKSLVVHYVAQGVLCYHELLEKPAVF